MPIRTVLERGPKDKKVVAFAVDWPGWSRGAKTADQALATLESYRERYRPVAGLGGSGRRVRRRRIARDRRGPSRHGIDRLLGHLLLARRRSSRDRWTRRSSSGDRRAPGLLGVLRRCRRAGLAGAAQGAPRRRARPGPDHPPHHPHRERGLREAGGVARSRSAPRSRRRACGQYRDAYLEAMRAYNAGEVNRPMRSWTLPFLIRHSAFHTLDHAWEMEDKDLSPDESSG